MALWVALSKFHSRCSFTGSHLSFNTIYSVEAYRPSTKLGGTQHHYSTVYLEQVLLLGSS